MAVGLLMVSPRQTLHLGVRARAVAGEKVPSATTSGAGRRGAAALLGRGGVSLVKSTTYFALLVAPACLTTEIICRSSMPPAGPSSKSDITVTVLWSPSPTPSGESLSVGRTRQW